MEWTDENTKLLIDLKKSGHTISRIAKILGAESNNRVSGKLRRLGMCDPTNSPLTDPEIARANRKKTLDMKNHPEKYSPDEIKQNDIERKIRKYRHHRPYRENTREKVMKIGQTKEIMANPPKIIAPREPKLLHPSPPISMTPPPAHSEFTPLIQRTSWGGRPKLSDNRPVARPARWSIMPMSHPKTCQWPIGEPRTPDFRFCDEPSEYKSYCGHHARIAFVRIRDRREDHVP